MFARLPGMIGCLAAVVTAYWAYALVVVPWIEPQVHLQPPSQPAEADRPTFSRSSRWQGQQRLFPPDAWELDRPKVLEAEQGTLLFQDYQTLDQGRLELSPVTLIVYTGGNSGSGTDATSKQRPPAPQRPVILRAPEGAVLHFDGSADLNRGELGRLLGGRLTGEVTIRSPESRLGADDQWELVTRHVQIERQRIWTPHDVAFRFGPHRGSGRDLTIRLEADDQAAGSAASEHDALAPPSGQLKSLELVRLHKLQLEIGQAGPLAPSGQRPDGHASLKPASDPLSSEPPPSVLEITCQGPFQFDFDQNVASFEDEVDVVRLNPDGPGDQLHCRLLALHFRSRSAADEPEPGNQPADAEQWPEPSAEAPSLGPRSLEIERIVAVGHPVLLRAPSAKATLRGERLEYNFQTRRVYLEDSRKIMLRLEGHQIEAPQVEYELAGQGLLGRLWAAGPGRFVSPYDADEPADRMEAVWGRELRLQPHQNQHVLSLLADAGVRAGSQGGFTAREIHLWLHEGTADGPSSSDSASHPSILPDRMLAVGQVRVQGPPLSGKTERLEMWFEHQVDLSPATGLGERPPAPLAQPPPWAADNGSQTARHPQSLHFSAELVRVKLLCQGRETWPDHVSVRGRPAQVRASNDLALDGNHIQLDREDNRLWIAGPGHMTLPVRQSDQAGPIGSLSTVTVSWQGGLNFDGRTVHFARDVRVQGQHQLALAQTLDVVLTRRLDFSQPRAEGLDARQFVFDGNVWMENLGYDEDQQLSSIDRMQVRNLAIDQHSGQLHADGPGWVRTVRRGGGETWAMQRDGQTAQRPAASAAGLSCLHVEFQNSIVGQLHQREIRFRDRVRTLYGPVAGWEAPLDADRLENLGDQGVLLTCQQLAVAEMGAAGQPRSLELQALGNTTIEGRSFTARAHRLSYAEAKDLLVLEGDGRSDAELWRQTRIGGPASHAAARKILYWRDDGRIEVDDARLLDLGELGPPNARSAQGSVKVRPRR